MIAITSAIRPYGGHIMGWTNPVVIGELAVGLLLLAVFLVIERRVANPMFDLQLFKIRAFTFGTFSSFLSSLARGGLMFILIIWLQGIWLPLHGFNYSETPLWAGIAMLPLSLGILIAGPVSGYLSDRYGSRPFATGGMIAAILAFVLLMLLPIDFLYVEFGAIILLSGIGTGAFASPNRAGVMNSLPPRTSRCRQRHEHHVPELGAGPVHRGLLLADGAGHLGAAIHSLSAGLQSHGVSQAVAERAAHLPPISVIFAAFLGFNPIEHLIGAHTLATLPAAAVARIVQPGLLPVPHIVGISFRPRRGLRVRGFGLRGRGHRLLVSREAVCA